MQHTRLGFAFLRGRRWASLFHGETMRRWSVGRNQDYIMYDMIIEIFTQKQLQTFTNVNSHINVPIYIYTAYTHVGISYRHDVGLV